MTDPKQPGLPSHDRPAAADACEERAAGIVLVRPGEVRGPNEPGEPGEPRVLVLRNARHRTWGFAKGHLEPGETDAEAAAREVLEETGLAPGAYTLVAEFSRELRYEVLARCEDRRASRENLETVPKTVIATLAIIRPDAVLRLSDEHDEARWVTAAELPALVPFPDLLALLGECLAIAAAAAPAAPASGSGP